MGLVVDNSMVEQLVLLMALEPIKELEPQLVLRVRAPGLQQIAQMVRVVNLKMRRYM